MSSSFAIWAVAAVLVFWAVGAYNRLVGLRSQARAAFARLDQQLTRHVHMVRERCRAVTVQGRPGATASLLGAVEQLEGSLDALRRQPLQELAAQALTTACKVMQVAWGRVASAPPDLAGSALPESLLLEWQEIAGDAEHARAEFNLAVARYNEAAEQFPAVLMARLFGWRRAQSI